MHPCSCLIGKKALGWVAGGLRGRTHRGRSRSAAHVRRVHGARTTGSSRAPPPRPAEGMPFRAGHACSRRVRAPPRLAPAADLLVLGRGDLVLLAQKLLAAPRSSLLDENANGTPRSRAGRFASTATPQRRLAAGGMCPRWMGRHVGMQGRDRLGGAGTHPTDMRSQTQPLDAPRKDGIDAALGLAGGSGPSDR